MAGRSHWLVRLTVECYNRCFSVEPKSKFLLRTCLRVKRLRNWLKCSTHLVILSPILGMSIPDETRGRLNRFPFTGRWLYEAKEVPGVIGVGRSFRSWRGHLKLLLLFVDPDFPGCCDKISNGYRYGGLCFYGWRYRLVWIWINGQYSLGSQVACV